MEIKIICIYEDRDGDRFENYPDEPPILNAYPMINTFVETREVDQFIERTPYATLNENNVPVIAYSEKIRDAHSAGQTIKYWKQTGEGHYREGNTLYRTIVRKEWFIEIETIKQLIEALDNSNSTFQLDNGKPYFEVIRTR